MKETHVDLSSLSYEVIVIMAPPTKVAFPFVLDLHGYPTQIINFFIVVVRYINYSTLLLLIIPRVYFGCDGKRPTTRDLSKVNFHAIV